MPRHWRRRPFAVGVPRIVSATKVAKEPSVPIIFDELEIGKDLFYEKFQRIESLE